MKSRPLKIALVFILLGPVFAYLALLPLGLIRAGMVHDGFGGVFAQWTSGLAHIKGFYLLALVPAAFAAVAALVLSGRRDAEFVIGSLIAGGLAAVALTNLFGARIDLPMDGPFGYAFVGAVAAGICALVSRR